MMELMMDEDWIRGVNQEQLEWKMHAVMVNETMDVDEQMDLI